jgi:hypothetical protein
MPVPLLVLVTPASEKTDSVQAFEDELGKLGWVLKGGNANLTFQPYSAEDDSKSLAVEAQTAVNNVQTALTSATPPSTVVFVTAGLAATSAVVQYLAASTIPPATASTIPIVQAAGGWLPSPLPGNVTGFVLNPLEPFHAFGTSEKQLKKLVSKSSTALVVGLLYDSTNGPSTTGARDAVEALAPTLNPQPQIVRIDTPGDLQTLKQNFTVTSLQANTGPANPHPDCNGFMLLPNAQFYEVKARQYIAQTVEANNSPVKYAIYPEREYKKAHTKRNNKFVHGHHIPITFRLAALYVDSLLDGTVAIADLAPQEALADED